MGKYFNINPTTGEGGTTPGEISVTPISGFTGRGPVTENLIVELQDDESAKQTVVCSRTGKKTDQSDLNATVKVQRSTSTGDTIPDSDWEDLVEESTGGMVHEFSIPKNECWIKVSYKINLAACKIINMTSASAGFKKQYVRINGKYLTGEGALNDVLTEYSIDISNSKLANIAGDPGVLAQMSVEVIVKCSATEGVEMNAIGSYWGDDSNSSVGDSAVEYQIKIAQSSDSQISVSPESLNFETSTSEKKNSVKAISPWRAYIQNA